MREWFVRAKGLTAAIGRWLAAWINLYLAGLLTWFGLWVAAGERIAAVELASQLAVWFFLPLLLVAPLCLLVRSRITRIGTALAIFPLVWLWGGLFIPRAPTANVADATLTVMTYNALGPQSAVEASLGMVRSEQADVVAIQELNFDLARVAQTALVAEYPYQVLHPEGSVLGMGVLSKYPLTPNGDQLPPPWIGSPQLLTLDWDGRRVSLVNFHAWPPQMGDGSYEELAAVLRMQARQGKAIAAYAGRKMPEGAVIAVGDANATHLSGAYREVAGALADSWWEVGRGLGHTWGGSKLPETPFGPLWIARIDYVFHSHDLVALEARVAKHDGVSDHRGVVVKLAARRSPP